MQATRHKILEILKTQSQATVSDLAEALQMAPVSVRHHLDVLQSQDLVTTQTVHKRTVGRPEQVYLLTSEANKHFPNNFQGLSAVVLDELKKHLTTAGTGHVPRPGRTYGPVCTTAGHGTVGRGTPRGDHRFPDRQQLPGILGTQRGQFGAAHLQLSLRRRGRAPP
ncbi:MAG: ArsR family transcriptional regulator [Anaerolineae bacterium]|nr:MAG: ArsR family transcriptional regulator [Anaerolineae bacterium]